MRFVCWLFGHRWHMLHDAVRDCERCGARQVLKAHPQHAFRSVWQ